MSSGVRNERFSSVPALATLSVGALVIAQLPTFLTGAVGVQLQRDLGFGATELGAAITASLGMSFLGSVYFGRLVQRRGWTVGMRLAAVIAALTLAGVAFLARSWLPLVGLLVLAGVSKSAAHPAANLAIAVEVPRHRQGLIFGIKQAGVPAAAMLGGLSVPLVALEHGWQTAFALAAGLALVFAVLVPRRGPAGTPAAPRGTADGKQSSATKPRKPAAEPDTGRAALIVLAAGAGLGVAVANSVAGFLTTYAVHVGYAEGSAGFLLAGASLIGMTSRVVIGWFADKIDIGLGTVALLLVIGAGGVLLLMTGVPALVGVGSVIAFGAGWAWAGVFNLAVVRRNPSAPAVATGYTQAGVYAGAGLGPLAFGVLVDHVSFPVAWLVLALLSVVAAAIMMAADQASAAPDLAVD